MAVGGRQPPASAARAWVAPVSVRSPRFMYVEYAGDVIGTFRKWLSGKRDSSEVADTYSGQFLDAFHEYSIRMFVPARKAGTLKSGDIQISNCYHPLSHMRGALWHLSQIIVALSLLYKAVCYMPTHLYVSSLKYWFLIAPIKALGTRITVIYRSGPSNRGRLDPMLNWIHVWFLKRFADSIIALEPRLTRVLYEVAPQTRFRIVGFIPSFPASDFPIVDRPPLEQPLRLMYAGRIEEDKGVFDLIDVVAKLRVDHKISCVCAICGDGSDVECLRPYIDRRKLNDQFHMHGKCTAPKMRSIYTDSHICVVPTRSACPEGFNKVIAEAVLHRVPVVSSSVCPSTELLKDAVVSAEPDDTDSYAKAIASIVETQGEYERLICAAGSYRAFLLSHGKTFRKALEACAENVVQTDEQ